MLNLHRLWNKGLGMEIRQKLLNRCYRFDEIDGIYHVVSNAYRARRKAFKRLVIILLVLFIFMMVCNWMNIEDKRLAVISCIIPFLISTLAMIYAYFVWVAKEKKQFMKWLYQGYPELAGEYEWNE